MRHLNKNTKNETKRLTLGLPTLQESLVPKIHPSTTTLRRLKLWLRKDIDLILTELKVLKKIIIKNAEKNIDIIMPGFTHLQTAQPISAGHYYMSYYEMFMRDTDRFIESRERLNKNPLGSCAMAGTSFKIDRFETSKKLCQRFFIKR